MIEDKLTHRQRVRLEALAQTIAMSHVVRPLDSEDPVASILRASEQVELWLWQTEYPEEAGTEASMDPELVARTGWWRPWDTQTFHCFAAGKSFCGNYLAEEGASAREIHQIGESECSACHAVLAREN